jgi:hypothetical protein
MLKQRNIDLKNSLKVIAKHMCRAVWKKEVALSKENTCNETCPFHQKAREQGEAYFVEKGYGGRRKILYAAPKDSC